MSNEIKILKLIRSGSSVRLKISSLEKPLVVDEITAFEHRLVDGIVITAPQLNLLQKASVLWTCRQASVKLIGQREHSSGELRLKLLRKGYDREAVVQVISQFRKENLLDDEAYAYRLAQRTMRDKPCGQAMLMGMLQRKHIERELAERIAAVVVSEQDMREQAQSALRRKWRELRQLELEVARKKAYNYLSRRGFSYETAKDAFEKLISETKSAEAD